MIIYPDVITTPDTPTIRFSQSRDQINLNVELPRILHAQGWGCGTYFNVQFLNHEKTKLLACAQFVVVEEVETLQTSDADPYRPMTKTVFSRRAERIGDWWDSESVERMRETIVNAGPRMADPPRMEVADEPKRRGRPPKAALTPA